VAPAEAKEDQVSEHDDVLRAAGRRRRREQAPEPEQEQPPKLPLVSQGARSASGPPHGITSPDALIRSLRRGRVGGWQRIS
jgi:hypothetical protein